MKIKLFYFILFNLIIHQVKSQKIHPYLEVSSAEEIKYIHADSLQAVYQFNHFISDIKQKYYYTNTSNQPVNLRFIVPQFSSQNVYLLNASYNEKTISLTPKSTQLIRQEIKNLKSKSGYENQIITQNLILNLTDVKPHAKIVIELNRSLIIEPSAIIYHYTIPELKVLRTQEFTATQHSKVNEIPKKINNTIIFTGGIAIESVTINNNIPSIIKKATNEWLTKNNSAKEQVISYQYQANQINTTVQHFTENDCDYILGIIQPPKDIKATMPREYIFIMDASGSMKGKPIEAVKKMIKSTLKQLQPNELFNILLYSTNHENLSPISLEATSDNLDKAYQFIDKEFGKGAIKLNEAIDRIQNFKQKSNYNRIITIISDGDLSINQNVHLSIKSQIKNAQFFILGIGNTINYRAMNYLSLTTGNKPIVINNENEAKGKIDQFQKQILQPLLRNIQVQSKNINFNETYPKNFNGFLSTSPINFISKDCKKIYPKQLQIAGKNGDENFNKTFILEKANNTDLTKAIKYYWAKQHIDFLLKDEDRCGDLCKKDGRYRKEIEKIGAEFNISTPYSVLIQNNDIENFNQDYDTDEDGVPDWLDDCIYEKGSILSKGCPVDQLQDLNKELYIQDLSNELIRTIEFNLDEAIIRPEDYPTLNKIIKIMEAYPALKFDIEGHTDARGSKEYNKNLALNRATAVLNYFETKGLNKNRFTIKAKGDTELKHPKCKPAEICEEWQNLQNRRVEFKLKKD